MRPAVLPLAGLAALVAPAPALAANVDVRSVDAPDNVNYRFEPAAPQVAVGDTVTWHFTGTTVVHNVASQGTNWSLRSELAVAGPPVTYRFTAAGTYAFVCEAHPGTMKGTVTVGGGGPPAPPPLGEQPFPNDSGDVPAEERVDETPRIGALRARGLRGGVRVRFRLSERGRVTVRVKRSGRTVRTRRVRVRTGTRAVTLRGLRAGRHRIELRATDIRGHRSATRRLPVRVR